jgi:hypothetical protein
MKFYFAAYDENTAPRKEYVGLQTLVMVGTKKKEIGNGMSKNKDLYIQTANGNEIVAYNGANLCPPFCQTGNDVEPGINFDII